MTTALVTKIGGLAKTAHSVREMDRRLERARQSFNEKLTRAQAEYVDAVGRAYAAVSETGQPLDQAHAADPPSHDEAPASA